MEEVKFNINEIDKTFAKYKKNDIFDGVVILKREDGVIFNIGGKSDAFISKEDFENFDNVKIGDRFKVAVLGSKNEEGMILVSKQIADNIIIGSQNAEKLKIGSEFSFYVTSVQNGSLISKMGMYNIVVPNSEIDTKLKNINFYINKQHTGIVTEINKNEKLIVCSIKMLKEQIQETQENLFWSSIFINKIVQGKVEHIVPYGAFINVDGIKYESDLTPELGITTKESTGDNENGGTGDDENGGTGDNENGNTGDEDDSDKKDMQYKIFAIGYSGVYDGKSHNAVTLEGVKKEVDTVTYSLDQKNWEETIPTVTDVKDSTTIYIKVEREGMAKAYEVMVVATVLPVSIENMDIRLKEATIEWDGENHMPEVLFGGCTLNKDYAVNGVQVYKNIGAYSVVVTGIGNYTGTKELIYTIDVVEGDKYTISGFVYKVTGDDTVSVAGVTNKKRKTVSVKATVQIGGKVYKITAIEKNAFKNSKKLKKVIIGKNITTIGTNAFYGCSKLKKVTIGKNVKSIGN